VFLERDTARFLARFERTIHDLDRRSLPRRSLAELMRVLDTLERECLERWTTPIVNDFYVMMSVGRLRRLVSRAVNDDVDRVMQTLLGGADVGISAAPALLILEMAAAARRDPEAAAALRDLDGREALRRAGEASADFARAYAALIERFGDRCMGELKLESRPMRDDPDFVVGILRNYLDGDCADPRALSDRARQDRERVEREVADRLRGPLERWRLRRALTAARRSIRARETMRLARTRLFGAYRDTYRAIGARLRDAGYLDAADDVLYLTVEEIDAHWTGTGVANDLRPLVAARRREFASFESIDAPNRIVTVGSPYSVKRSSRGPAAPSPRNPAANLHGLGCSPGIAEGRVSIVYVPSANLSLAGHVLVAVRTDPGWAPLFPSAAAILVERGSVLSHSAVLARELGLPAVVGIPDLTRILRDGELVRIDGTAGTVERLES
jgi:pyruvate,water dikinase